MGKKIGIDLGTTYSCMSYVDDDGIVRIIPNIEGEDTTPSVIYLQKEGDDPIVPIVGTTAKRQGGYEPKNIFERIKNHMGEGVTFFAHDQEYSPTALSSLILKKLISDAEKALGDTIDGAVITVPAYFGDPAKNATKLAGENTLRQDGSPLTVIKILDEPTSAAIAYVHSIREDVNKTFMVYDLGGGTFDCSVIKMDIKDGIVNDLTCITTGGNHKLGGKDWDAELTNFVLTRYCDTFGGDVETMKNNALLMFDLSDKMEQTKKDLTSTENAQVYIEYDGKREKIKITRAEFENCTKGLLEQTFMLIEQMISSSEVTLDMIDEFILVGGSTFMPQVERELKKRFNKPLVQYEPNKAVAMGAALSANGYLQTKNSEPDKPSNPGKPGKPGGGGIKEITNKSYGLKIYSKNEPIGLALIKKDDPKPTFGESGSITELIICGDSASVDEVEIAVFESISKENYIPLDQCEFIYLEEPIKFKGKIPGDTKVSIKMMVDQNSILSLELHEIENANVYKMNPRRKDADTANIGMNEVKKMQLKL